MAGQRSRRNGIAWPMVLDLSDDSGSDSSSDDDQLVQESKKREKFRFRIFWLNFFSFLVQAAP